MRLAALLETIAVSIVLSGCATTPRESPDLQGTWVVVSGEHEGKPMTVVVGGKLTVSGETFSIRTASGNELKGRIQVAASHSPAKVDLIHANGTRWIGIYGMENGSLRLNYVDAAGKEPRPVQFVTSDATEASLLVLQRATP